MRCYNINVNAHWSARDQVCRTGPKIGKQEINEQELENKVNYRKQIAR